MADLVMFLYREDYQVVDDEVDIIDGVSEVNIKVAKNRNGSLDIMKLMFDKRIGKFFDIAN